MASCSSATPEPARRQPSRCSSAATAGSSWAWPADRLAGAHADDVFQATFLALARAAGRLENQPLANWLFTVALRQARKLHAANFPARDAGAPRPPPPRAGSDPLDEITGRELLQAIDDELARLPERYRLPLLLCGVQGLSREEAAAELGWSEGVVKGRLERGRKRLAARLTARGLAPSAVLLAPLASAVVPSELLARTIALAASPWAESVPPTVASLATSGLVPRGMADRGAGGMRPGGRPRRVGHGNRQEGHADEPAPTRQIADARPAARAQPDDEDPLPAGSNLRFGTDRFRHGTTIQNLSISADGKLAVAGSGTRRFGAVRVYDLKTGRVLATLAEQHEYVVAVALSPDGKTVAVKRGDHAVHFYDAATGRATGHIPYPTANPSSMTEWLSYSPDGKRLLVGTATGDGVHLIDRDKLDVVRTFKHDKVVFAAAFSPDGKLIAAGGYDREKNAYFARLWEADTGAELRRFVVRQRRHPLPGVLARRQDACHRRRRRQPACRESVRRNEREGTRQARDPRCHQRRIGRVRTGRQGPWPPRAEPRRASSTRRRARRRSRSTTRPSACGSHRTAPRLFGAVSGTIYRWDVKTGNSFSPESADGVIAQIEVAADGKRLVTRGQDGDAHLWDAVTGEHVHRVTVAWQRGLALSPDGRFLVWPVADEKVRYKDPADPRTRFTPATASGCST